MDRFYDSGCFYCAKVCYQCLVHTLLAEYYLSKSRTKYSAKLNSAFLWIFIQVWCSPHGPNVVCSNNVNFHSEKLYLGFCQLFSTIFRGAWGCVNPNTSTAADVKITQINLAMTFVAYIYSRRGQTEARKRFIYCGPCSKILMMKNLIYGPKFE